MFEDARKEGTHYQNWKIDGQRMAEEDLQSQLKDCADSLSQIMITKHRLQDCVDNLKEQQKKLNDTGKKSIHESLRYTSEDLLFMHQIISRTTQQSERTVQDIERTMKEAFEMEQDTRKLLNSVEPQSPKRKDGWKSRRNRDHLEKWKIPKRGIYSLILAVKANLQINSKPNEREFLSCCARQYTVFARL